jgi:ATP-dependent helicase/nuclease subunit A
MILSSATPLDWLGPAAAAAGAGTIQVAVHGEEEVLAWTEGATGWRASAERIGEVGDLKPLAEGGTVSAEGAEAAEVIARFESVYPYDQFTKLGAATSPTAMKTDGSAAGTSAACAGPGEESLPLPKFLSADSGCGLSATQIGDATHLVLEHLDFGRSCDQGDLEGQIEALVGARFLRPQQAAAVDREAIVWLMGTPLGKQMRSGRVWRELPFAASASAGMNSGDRLDAVMIRGRIDLLVETAGGVAVVDYKTDRVGAGEVEERAESYRGQIEVYRRSVEDIAGKAVTDVFLVFLHPRVIWRLPTHHS